MLSDLFLLPYFSKGLAASFKLSSVHLVQPKVILLKRLIYLFTVAGQDNLMDLNREEVRFVNRRILPSHVAKYKFLFHDSLPK